MTDPQPALPLAGLRVLDLTQFLSGPYGTMILADLGADVIKLEPPEGELSRTIPPHFVGTDSVYYLSVNRNKRSVAADLKTPEGLALARSLALAADVVVENNRPGVLARLGLDYEEMSRAKPSLVWCSITGFGQDGPWRDWPAYDMVVQALSGGMSLTGEPDGLPVRAGIPLGDLAAGMYAVIGVLAAIHERQRTGRGRWVDVGMFDCQLSMLSYQAAYFLHSGQVPGRQGAAHDSIPTYRSFVASDGMRVVVAASTEKMWRALVEVLDVPELASDARFTTNRERFANRVALWPLLERAFATRDAQAWMTSLIAAGVPAGVVNTVDRALLGEHAEARGMVLPLQRDDAQAPVRVAGNPVKFVGAGAQSHRYPPSLGQDTQEVLAAWLHESERTLQHA
jgi:crotonobetainyl-CoA:carnitine CoA-transferase CaiB-like acyl-CoA transferase